MAHPVLPTAGEPTAGDLGHLGHHDELHGRFNNSVEILSGTTAARPLATAVEAGTLYWDTDTELLYRSNGTTWDQLSAGVADHGALTGLADDDHTQYLKEKASGGTAAETPTHNHSAANQAGTLDHGASLTGLTDDDHTQYLKEKASGGVAAEVPTHNHSAAGEAGTLDHGALTGLADDDHTQYHTAARHAAVDAADHGSGASADGTVLTSDGAGGAAWEALTGGATYVYKTADEVVNNSNVNQDDDHLFFTIEANGVYAWEFFLDYFSGSTPDLKIEWVEPDGTFTFRTLYEDGGGTSQNNTRYESTAAYAGAGLGVAIPNSIWGAGVIRAGATGGTFKLQWSQSLATASDTTLRKGSWLSYKKLN